MLNYKFRVLIINTTKICINVIIVIVLKSNNLFGVIKLNNHWDLKLLEGFP